MISVRKKHIFFGVLTTLLCAVAFQNFETISPKAPEPLLAPVKTPSGPTVYVSAAGDPKTANGSVTHPYPNVNMALNFLKATGGTILLADKIYTGPWNLIGLKKPTLVKPANQIKPILSCANSLNGWQLVNGTQSIYKLKTDAGVGQVFLNGQFLRRARYPEYGFLSAGADGPPEDRPYSTLITTESDAAFFAKKNLENATVTIRNIDFYFSSAVVGSFNSKTKSIITNPTPLQPNECSETALSPYDSSKSKCGFWYPTLTGWGYFLENKLWMMTENSGQPGSWVFDAPSSTLYVWMPDSSHPEKATNLQIAYDNADCLWIADSPQLTIQGLQILNSGRNGVSIIRSPGLRLNQVTVKNVYKAGISALNSDPLLIDQSTISNTGSDGIVQATSDENVTHQPTTIENNTITNIGTAAGFRKVRAGIYVSGNLSNSQNTARIRNNFLSQLAYDGIYGGYNVIIEHNTVEKFCLYLDDCGGIYVTGRSISKMQKTNITISENMVSTATAYMGGKPAQRGRFSVAGIYLDDFSHGVLVRKNSVNATDVGFFGHNFRNNVIKENIFADSNFSAISTREDDVRRIWDSKKNIWYFLDSFGNPTLNEPKPAIPSMVNNKFVGNLLIGNSTSEIGLVRITSTLVPDNSPQEEISSRAQAAYSGYGNSYSNLIGPLQFSIMGQKYSMDAFSNLKLDFQPKFLSSRATAPAPWEPQRTTLYQFSPTNNKLYSWDKKELPETQLVTCPVPSESGICSQTKTSANALAPILVKTLPFALKANVVYRAHVQIMTAPGMVNSTIGMMIRQNGQPYSNLDSLHPNPRSIFVNSRGWTTYDFNFKPYSDIPANGSRIDIILPIGTAVIIGGLTVSEVTAPMKPLGSALYTFSSSDESSFLTWNSSGTVTKKLVTCAVPSQTDAYLKAKTLPTATANAILIKPLLFPIIGEKRYRVHLQIMGEENSKLSMILRRGVAPFENLDSLHEFNHSISLNSSGWTDYDFEFATVENFSSGQTRLDFYLPQASSIYIGALTIAATEAPEDILYSFSKESKNDFSSWDSLDVKPTIEMVSCSISSDSNAFLYVESSPDAVNSRLVKYLPFALKANQSYLVELQTRGHFESGIFNLKPQITNGAPNYENLDLFKQDLNLSVNPGTWTESKFYFKASTNTSNNTARLNLNFPSGSGFYLGGLKITPVDIQSTSYQEYGQILVNTSFTETRLFKCADVGFSCENWSDIRGNSLSFPYRLPPRSLVPIWQAKPLD